MWLLFPQKEAGSYTNAGIAFVLSVVLFVGLTMLKKIGKRLDLFAQIRYSILEIHKMLNGDN